MLQFVQHDMGLRRGCPRGRATVTDYGTRLWFLVTARPVFPAPAEIRCGGAALEQKGKTLDTGEGRYDGLEAVLYTAFRGPT